MNFTVHVRSQFQNSNVEEEEDHSGLRNYTSNPARGRYRIFSRGVGFSKKFRKFPFF